MLLRRVTFGRSEENEEGSDKKATPIGEKASPSKEAIVENV